MALIKCPECGREISDQVKKCPNCGYPIKKGLSAGKGLAILAGCIIVVAGGFIYYQKVIIPRNTYNKAVSLYEKSDYANAESLFLEVENYKDSADYLENIENEKKYIDATDKYKAGDIETAEALFLEVEGYKDSAEYIEKIGNEKIYHEASSKYEAGDIDEAEKLFSSISGYSDADQKLEEIQKLKIYNQAYTLFEDKEYSQALELLEPIEDYSDAAALIDQMNADYEFNTYIDTLKKYGFFANSVENLGIELIDDVRSIWYNCIYEEDSYLTDEYTKDSRGNFYDDFNTALFVYFSSDDYSRQEEKIEEGRAQVDDLFNSVKKLPDELKECGTKAAALQTAFTSVIDFSLNIEGSLSSATDSARAKHDTFNTAYSDFKLSIPDKKVIDPSKESVYDFRSMNIGMSKDDVIDMEKNVYGNSIESSHWRWFLCYDGVTFDGYENPVNITYSLDTYGFVDAVWVSLPEGTNNEEALKFVETQYGDRFDGKKYITANNEYPYLSVDVMEKDEETLVFFNPITQEDYDEQSGNHVDETQTGHSEEIETEEMTEEPVTE